MFEGTQEYGRQTALPPHSMDNDESYKDKFENVKLLVHQLQKDLQSERVRNEGVKIISDCLEEERNENQQLRQQLRELERAVTILQNRLQQNGVDAAVSLQEGEILLPGPSKALLDNLLAENTKLKQTQRFMDVDPSKVEQLTNQVSQLTNQLKEEQERSAALHTRNDQLQAQLTQSKDSKDQKILGLEDCIGELRRNKDTQNILCQSLSEQTVSLKTQLQSTMSQMQQLMRQMEQDQDCGPDLPRESSSLGYMCMAEAEELREQIAKMKEEREATKKKFKEQEHKLKEVVEMNSKWQVYNKQRDQHVRKLRQQLEEKNKGEPKLTASDQEQVDRIILQYKEKMKAAEEDKQKVEDENRQLRVEVDRQKKSLGRTNAALDDLKNQPGSLDKDKIMAYESQIKVITEDFIQEREDRTREHQKVEQLEEELARVKAELESLQRTSMEDIAQRRQSSLRNYEIQYQNQAFGRMRPVGTAQAGYIGRGGQYECDGDEEENVSEDVIDSVGAEGGDKLQCPNCQKDFGMEQHADFLEHLNECCA